MGKESASRGVSKLQWLDAGLDALTRFPATDIKVDALARTLGIARAGFYWHFKNRDEYFLALLDHWHSLFNESVAAFLEDDALSPQESLLSMANTIVEDQLGKYDLTLRCLEYLLVVKTEPLVVALRQGVVLSGPACASMHDDSCQLISCTFLFFFVPVNKPTQKFASIKISHLSSERPWLNSTDALVFPLEDGSKLSSTSISTSG